MVLSAKALQDHDTVISLIDAVVDGKEMSVCGKLLTWLNYANGV